MSTFSLSNSPWKINIVFNILAAAALIFAAMFPKSAVSDMLLSLAPVELDKVPYFCLLGLVGIWLAIKVVVAMGVANSPICKQAYENVHPRLMNNPEYMGKVLYRVQCAHENTLEAIVIATAAAVIGSNTGIDSTIFAKLSMLNLVARIIYPFMYAVGPDMFRTLSFAIGGFASIWIAIYGIFPELA